MTAAVSKSVQRTFDVIKLFEAERRPLRAKDVEIALELPQASALVLLKALSDLGYLTFNAKTKRYFPSLALARSTAWIDEAVIGDRKLVDLADQLNTMTGQTTCLCSEDGFDLDFLYVRAGTTPHLAIPQVGLGLPLILSGTGCSLLATRGREDVEAFILDSQRKALPSNDMVARLNSGNALHKIVQPQDIHYFIGIVRQRGYLPVYDYVRPGLSAIVFPIRPRSFLKPVALSVTGPSEYIRAQESQIVGMVRQTLKPNLH